MAKVKYVLIGFGGIAENRVAKEGYACDKKRFKPLKTAQLVGATDMNPARQAAAEALGLKWYASLDEVLADKTVDGVYIATNNASHAALALAALKAGKHVIVEKPAATSVADAKKMEALAKKKGLSLTVDHMMVNNAWNVAGKAAIAAGGTTIRSYTSSLGITGLFQTECTVHMMKTCGRCGGDIHMKRIGGRSSYYCPHCQK